MSDSVIGHQIATSWKPTSTMDDAREMARDGAPEGRRGGSGAAGARSRDASIERGSPLPDSKPVLHGAASSSSFSQLPYMNMAATLAVHGTVSHFEQD